MIEGRVREGDWIRLGEASSPYSWKALVCAVVSDDSWYVNGPEGSMAHRRDVTEIESCSDEQHKERLREFSERSDGIGRVCRAHLADLLDGRGEYLRALDAQWPGIGWRVAWDGERYACVLPPVKVVILRTSPGPFTARVEVGTAICASGDSPLAALRGVKRAIDDWRAWSEERLPW